MEVAIGIASLFIAWVTLYYTVFSQKKEEKEHKQTLLATFKMTQQLSKEVSGKMYDVVSQADGWDTEMMPGVTYKSYYNALIESQNTNLSDDLYRKLLNSNYPKSMIATMQESINAQYNDLLKLQSALKLVTNTY
jgi:hypothetical protein